ncbi:MAG: DUF2061 domain-containing protein [Nonlabens sp.]
MDVTRKRHIAKTITWRVIASVTTFALAFIFFQEDPDAITKASGVAIAESIIKMVLYYYHERFWYKSNFGIEGERTTEDEGKK